jgi:hypothetical protein
MERRSLLPTREWLRPDAATSRRVRLVPVDAHVRYHLTPSERRFTAKVLLGALAVWAIAAFAQGAMAS